MKIIFNYIYLLLKLKKGDTSHWGEGRLMF